MDRLKVEKLGSTRTGPSRALESHEPTSSRNQKRYWCEPLADSVSVLYIGMPELVDCDDVKDMSKTRYVIVKWHVLR